MTPEFRKSDLDSVRRFLTSLRDEERRDRSPRGRRVTPSPLRGRVAQARRRICEAVAVGAA